MEDFEGIARELAIEMICPSSGEPRTSIEITLVNILVGFGIKLLHRFCLIEELNVVHNIAALMVADSDEELSCVHMDETEGEVDTIECLRDKARSINKALDKLLEGSAA